jgi:prevent-host-death family protein
MKTLPLTEVETKLSALIDGLAADDEEIVITRNGVAAAVLVSPDELDRRRETLAIQLDAEIMREIRAGLDQLEAGKARLYTLQELFNDGSAPSPPDQPGTDGA